MELSLDDLQSALQAVQEQKSSARLSERNVVELINKIQELGLVGNDLLHSINGREYLTKEHLEVEVKQILHQTGGRAALVELPALLGMDFVHCEAAAETVVSHSHDVIKIQGELMTIAYQDSLASEANQLLQEAGVISMGELAHRYNLSTEFVQSLIEQRMDTHVNGRLHSSHIFTAAHVGRIKSQLRGALRAALRPVIMQQLLRSLGLDGAGIQGVPVPGLVDELVKEGSLHGVLKAGVWVPHAHARAQQEAVLSFYNQNQYIGFDMMAKLGVAGDPLEYIYPLLPDGYALSTAFVHPNLLEQVDAAAEEALTDSSWVDVQPLLPSALNSADAGLLLAECATVESLGSGKKAEGWVLAGTCLVSRDLLEELTQRACAEAQSLAATALQERRKAAAAAPSSQGQGPGNASSDKASKAAEQAAMDDSDDDDWDASAKSSAKKKRGGKRRGATPAKPKAPVTQTSKQKAPDPAAAHRGRLAAEPLAALLLEWAPDMEGCGEEGGLAAAIAAELRSPAQAAFDTAMQAVFTAGAEARRQRREQCQTALSSAWAQLQAHARGLHGLAAIQASDLAAYASIERLIVRQHVSTATDLLLQLLQVDVQEDNDDAEVPSSLSAAERVRILNQLPPHVQSAVSDLLEKVNGSSLQEAIAAMEAVAEQAGARLRKLDRKAEKMLVSDHAQALRSKLVHESDPAAALSIAVPLLIAQKLGLMVSIPGRALGPAISMLMKHLDATSHSLLVDFQKRVVQMLKAQDSDSDMPALQDQLCHLLPALKTIAGAGADTSHLSHTTGPNEGIQ